MDAYSVQLPSRVQATPTPTHSDTPAKDDKQAPHTAKMAEAGFKEERFLGGGAFGKGI